MSSGRAESDPSCVSTTKTVMDLLSESKAKDKDEVLYITEHYTAIQRSVTAKQFEKILFLDIDETIIDYELSLKNQKLVFIHEEKLRQVIKHAIEKNILIVLATSRTYNEYERDGLLVSAKNIAKELGADNFGWTFFTAGKCKSPILDYFWMYHFDLVPDAKNCLCLVDDNPRYVDPCRAKNYPVIVADKNDASARYLDLANEFLDQKNIPSKEAVILMTVISDDETKEGCVSFKL